MSPKRFADAMRLISEPWLRFGSKPGYPKPSLRDRLQREAHFPANLGLRECGLGFASIGVQALGGKVCWGEGGLICSTERLWMLHNST